MNTLILVEPVSFSEHFEFPEMASKYRASIYLMELCAYNRVAL